MNKNIILVIVAVIVVGIGGVIFYKNSSSTPRPVPVATNATTTIAMSEIVKHNDQTSCYTTINGGVYDLTSWINQHPGGSKAILSLCGKDGTDAFVAQHGGQKRPEAELASLKIGILAQ